MRIYEFENFLDEVVSDYNERQGIYGRDEAMRQVAHHIKNCCSVFEEETLVERLKEEYLKAA